MHAFMADDECSLAPPREVRRIRMSFETSGDRDELIEGCGPFALAQGTLLLDPVRRPNLAPARFVDAYELTVLRRELHRAVHEIEAAIPKRLLEHRDRRGARARVI